MVPAGWIRFFRFSIQAIILLQYEQVRVRVVVLFFVFFGFVQQDTSIWYHMIYSGIKNVVLSFFGALYVLRLTAGAVVLIRKCTTLQRVPWLYASIPEESYTISLWSSTATSGVNIRSLIGRRNSLMTEAANSRSAAAGPELSTSRNPIANLASD